MIKIIDHRSAWCDDIKNFSDASLQGTLEGAKLSFSRGRGIEMDVRDCNGKIVVTQSLPVGGELLFEDVLKAYKQSNCDGLLAVDIKSCWIQREVKRLLDEYDVTNYFCFGMSIPETLGYLNINAKTYLRDSEYEQINKDNWLYDSCEGVWLDQFNAGEPTRVNLELIKRYVSDGKQVCICSPDLHGWGRSYNDLLDCWIVYKTALESLTEDEQKLVSICTNLPLDAERFFS